MLANSELVQKSEIEIKWQHALQLERTSVKNDRGIHKQHSYSDNEM